MIQKASEQKANFILLLETIEFACTHPSSLDEAELIPGKFSNLLCEFR